jgi:hypothetical protein
MTHTRLRSVVFGLALLLALAPAAHAARFSGGGSMQESKPAPKANALGFTGGGSLTRTLPPRPPTPFQAKSSNGRFELNANLRNPNQVLACGGAEDIFRNGFE